MKQNLSKLMEAELDKAATILAVQEMGDSVQKMAEDVAKMRSTDVMALTEQIKEQFGQDEGARFSQEMNMLFEQLQEQITETKNQIDSQVGILNGDQPAGMTDMTSPLGMDMNSEMTPPGLEGGDMEGIDDMFGADDALAGGDDSPMGRPMREAQIKSMRRKIRILEKKLKR